MKTKCSTKRKLRPLGRAICLGLLSGALAPVALAQDEETEDSGSGVSTLMEEVLVTARKREEPAQETPVALSAYNSDQLEALKIRDLSNLTVSMPNVSLDDIGTVRGLANFSIRGLGINSSIPSIDPTVGVFIDGVYLGLNSGTVIDMFDIASIEVLRGPQGTLFGRNVTGGAVLINTKQPTQEFEMALRGAMDGNPNGDGGSNYYAMASVSGGLTDNLLGRMSVYYNKDDGWFTNLLNGENHGESETVIVRPVVNWGITEDVDLTARWEHLESDNQGPASQTHTNGLGRPGFFANFERDSFDFSIDNPGFYDFDSDLATLQIDWRVGLGDGVITNILGYREFYSESDGDIDAQPRWLFHSTSWTDQEQLSNELRFVGSFGAAQVTTGLFWFTNEIDYHERRNLIGIATGGVRPAVTQDGGGLYDVDSVAWFGSVDYDLGNDWTLTGGLRYTNEDKAAQIVTLTRNTNRPLCNIVLANNCTFDFNSEAGWNAWDGKAGAMYRLSDNMRFYGHWSRSHRSGGYNLRNTAIDTVNLGPGPFDEEQVDSLEFGMKSEFAQARLNLAVFFNDVENMQRELNLADPLAGVVQVIKNTADADLNGLEVDGLVKLGQATLITFVLGYVDAEYSEVLFDLNSDGVINEVDKALELPRSPELTWNIGLNHDFELGSWGLLSGRVSYGYRDEAFYTDNNLGYFLDQEIVDAGLDWQFNESWQLSLYGRNLLDTVNHGGDTQLPATLVGVPTGGTFSPLVKGRVVGLEVSYSLN